GLRVSRTSLVLDAAPLQVVVKENLEVMGHGNLSRLAPLLVEVEHPLTGGLVVVVTLEGGDGSNSRTRIGERLDDELVPQAQEVRRVDGGEQRSKLGVRYLRRLPFDRLIPHGLRLGGRVDEADVPLNEHSEIPPQGRERRLLLGRTARELREI